MPRNKYPEETVQKILDVSLELFLEKGYEETTVLDIIGRMGGLTRGAFYHHFKSKEEVFDALCEKLFYETNPFEKAKQHKDLNGLEKLKFVMKTSFDDTEHHKLSIASMQLMESPAFLKKLIESNKELFPMYQELIEEGIKDGSIQTEHSRLLAELFVLLTNFWSIPTIFPMTSEETWEKFLMIKEIMDTLGLPIIDDEIVELCKENA
ncbi:TetR/AcrR family transcriptional regulator [Clostridioides difficile]|uniref:TetR/AcrR family transcriptional regulator n=1 Tax=Clostridioides difficile TaxID=1496 RepID=UPI000D1EA311|nr:TetR/AcrR family transcriptional regulator [Clostridioides difficile]MDL5066214.1 TetR/AcrR family transcriptional regulator [Clostridioides difficile]MDN9455079.1 TetR/AcrR family transcriptional regulator [Clostridioides difficile]HBF7900610.1 TetR/AcrR family transcriptional regulator [Clostridioides difficile]